MEPPQAVTGARDYSVLVPISFFNHSGYTVCSPLPNLRFPTLMHATPALPPQESRSQGRAYATHMVGDWGSTYSELSQLSPPWSPGLRGAAAWEAELQGEERAALEGLAEQQGPVPAAVAVSSRRTGGLASSRLSEGSILPTQPPLQHPPWSGLALRGSLDPAWPFFPQGWVSVSFVH